MNGENIDYSQLKRTTVRRVIRHPFLIEYRQLAALVAVINIWVFFNGISSGIWKGAYAYNTLAISQVALFNFTLAILIRQQRIVNLLFWTATRIPTSWPIWIRWRAGKIFHFGGIHSSAAVAGSMWFAFGVFGQVANQTSGNGTASTTTLVLGAIMVIVMCLMITTAIGPLRQRFHNIFEHVHRFAGWSLLVCFWSHHFSLMKDHGQPFSGDVSTIILGLLTLSIISPWMTLKRVPIKVEKPSNHAVIVRFDYSETPFPGSSNALSMKPLREWHSFANIPAPGETGYRMIISRAGDWTGKFIDNPPSHIWVKGITTSGVARIERLFKKVVYVGTGSGIGPILPHLLAHDVPNRLIWSTRSPRKTYGDNIVDEIEAHSENPLIWDTDLLGKPDLAALAIKAVKDSDAEAIIVIANQTLTQKVIYEAESRGIPAFGAIWDS